MTINESIITLLKELRNTTDFYSGNSVEDIIKTRFEQSLKLKSIPSSQWKDKDSPYYEIRKLSLALDFDFRSIPDVDKTFLVHQPNGSQQWPDILIANNGIGFPIEIKSSKDGKIVWNGGLPKDDSLYIYAYTDKNTPKITFCLGQHLISERELKYLLDSANVCKQYNSSHADGRWGYYIRNMHNSRECMIVPEKEYKKLETERAKLTVHMSEAKLGKVLKSIQDINVSLADMEGKIRTREEETLDFISKLTWDCNQKTKFWLECDDNASDEVEQ